MKRNSLTVEEALRLAEMAERNLAAFEATAPKTVKALGGRDALARRSQNCCLGPMPKLTVQEWCAMSEEYEDTREHGSVNRGSPR
ncbi:hypothetical protein GCM10011487_22360 [Steroidobacter agaridevorans]|jgi:hypothetical protein|uniref:Uncharacterized protein n=1 Tax=Steroidobacter agaridevorans TaxID=2695856 RepID=A0A829YC55_9GAMM|nr:hypothetical protein [Steroidobacter agaridevorans]GFE80236.1 hypothetical protein GCM10011487_22360 [Steroidobacter agaridevorans]